MRQLKITKQVTNRETASLDKYLQEIGKGLISAEEVELAQRIKDGDEIALEKLTKLIFVLLFCYKTVSKPRTIFTRSY